MIFKPIQQGTIFEINIKKGKKDPLISSLFVFIIGIIISSMIMGFLIILSLFMNKKEKTSPQVLSSILPENTIEIPYRNNFYWIGWIEIEDNDNIFLYPNFIEKKSSKDLLEKSRCQKLVNGGFYTQDDKPLGLMISEGVKISDESRNTLIPKFFYMTYNKESSISYTLPNKNIRFAIQSGPVIIEDGIKKTVSIKNDKSARRVAVAITNDDKILFLVVYKKEEIMQGPYLSYLPEIIFLIQKKIGRQFKEVLNLDGGTASAFYTGSYSISEIAYIGSYFCIRN